MCALAIAWGILALSAVASHAARAQVTVSSLLSARGDGRSDAALIDDLIAGSHMDHNARASNLSMLAYRHYLSEYSRINTSSDAARFVATYGPEQGAYDPDVLIPRAQAYLAGQPLIPLERYQLDFLDVNSLEGLNTFMRTYDRQTIGKDADPKIARIFHLADTARDLVLIVQDLERESATAKADVADSGSTLRYRRKSDTPSTSTAEGDWWVQLQDLDNIHCEPTQGITFKDVIATVHKTVASQYIFVFPKKILAILPQVEQPVMVDIGSDVRNMLHTTHPVEVLMVDGKPYKGTNPFGRLYVYSKTQADCRLSIVYVHYLLGY